MTSTQEQPDLLSKTELQTLRWEGPVLEHWDVRTTIFNMLALVGFVYYHRPGYHEGLCRSFYLPFIDVGVTDGIGWFRDGDSLYRLGKERQYEVA